jgi:folate-binding protein YgfZ
LGSSSAALELSRIVAGWPRLGAEIDAKTLPQEVRLDELAAMSHSKGCYVGQETVARLHFRGHVNKRLLGLRFEAEPDAGRLTVTRDDRAVGRLTSAGWLGADRGYLGLAVLRREVAVGDEVNAGGVAAALVSLPFEVVG